MDKTRSSGENGDSSFETKDQFLEGRKREIFAYLDTIEQSETNRRDLLVKFINLATALSLPTHASDAAEEQELLNSLFKEAKLNEIEKLVAVEYGIKGRPLEEVSPDTSAGRLEDNLNTAVTKLYLNALNLAKAGRGFIPDEEAK
jgi:hypothetical protein